jgi:hypothetical protein
MVAKQRGGARKIAAPRPSAAPLVDEHQEPVYVALKVLVVGDKTYQPGEHIPEANGWLRVESWVRARRIALKEAS